MQCFTAGDLLKRELNYVINQSNALSKILSVKLYLLRHNFLRPASFLRVHNLNSARNVDTTQKKLER